MRGLVLSRLLFIGRCAVSRLECEDWVSVAGHAMSRQEEQATAGSQGQG